MNKYQKGFAPIIIALIVLILAGAGGTGYYLINKQSQKQTACTSEAKICPDGSLAGRASSSCEFLTCPEVKVDETSNWKTYTSHWSGFEIKFPFDWKCPFKKGDYGFTAGISLDDNNFCIIDVSDTFSSFDSEKADLIKKGYSQTVIKMNGIDGIRLTSNPSREGLTEALYFDANDKSFRISRNKGSGDKVEQDCIKNFNQMLYTFKLIDKEIEKSETPIWKNEKGEKVEDLIPEGWKIIKQAEGDLNSDNLLDKAIVIEKEYEDYSTRYLLIAFKDSNGFYNSFIQSDKAILRADQGDIFGDPFEGLSIENNILSIKFYGGTSWRWSKTYGFKYQNNGFYLIKKSDYSYKNTTDCAYKSNDYDFLTMQRKEVKSSGWDDEWASNRAKAPCSETEKVFDIDEKELLNLQNFDVVSL